MTDERLGDLLPVVRRMPRGAGIVFRHYATPAAERRALFAKVAKVARYRGLLLVRAGREAMAGEGGAHGTRLKQSHRLNTASVHTRSEAVAAVRAGVDLLFISPLFATRSHPGAAPLGPLRAATIIRGLNVPAIALGGMSRRRFRRLSGLGFHGWAAIDAWQDQKRNAVPI